MNSINEILDTLFKSQKVNSDNPDKEEFTVFIKVNIESLKEFSLLIPEIVNNNDKIVRDITKIITDIKYLQKSSLLNLKSKNVSLLIKRLFGFECETNSFIENLNKSNNLKNLIPELVEKILEKTKR